MFGSLSRSRYLPGYVWSPPSGTSAGCRRYLHLKTLFAFFISSTSSMDWSGVALESDEGAVGPLPTTISYLCVCVRLLGYSTHKKRCGDRLWMRGFMAADWKVIETTSWFRGLDNQARNTHSAHLLCYIEDLYSTTRFFLRPWISADSKKENSLCPWISADNKKITLGCWQPAQDGLAPGITLLCILWSVASASGSTKRYQKDNSGHIS